MLSKLKKTKNQRIWLPLEKENVERLNFHISVIKNQTEKLTSANLSHHKSAILGNIEAIEELLNIKK